MVGGKARGEKGGGILRHAFRGMDAPGVPRPKKTF